MFCLIFCDTQKLLYLCNYLSISDELIKLSDAMLKVSGLTLPDLNKSEHSEHVKKVFKYVADVSRKIDEKHQVSRHFIKLKEKIIIFFVNRLQTKLRMSSAWSFFSCELN